MLYKAFISYSHAADGRLAPAIQSGLHRFARPWYRLRALRAFRDDTDLSVSPGVWSSIESSLNDSEFFLLLASPEAAASKWVAREVEHWLAHRSAETLLLVLTDGELAWDPAAEDFDWARTTAVPRKLAKAYSEEPLHVDLRWARSEEDLSLDNPAFRNRMADLAATLHGRPKDEMIGEDVRQHRKRKRAMWSAVAGLALLTVTSVAGAWLAVNQRNEAERRRRTAVARQLAAESQLLFNDTQSPSRQNDDERVLENTATGLVRSLLLAVESLRLSPTREGHAALAAGLGLLKRPVRRLGHEGEVVAITFGFGGRWIVTGSEDGWATVWDVSTGAPQVRVRHGSPLRAIVLTRGDSLMATAGTDTTVWVWEVGTGAVVAELPHGDTVTSIAFAPDSLWLATASTDSMLRVWDVETGSVAKSVKLQDVLNRVAFSRAGDRLLAATGRGIPKPFRVPGMRSEVRVWDLFDGRLLARVEHRGAVAAAAFSPDGSRVASAGESDAARIWKVENGEVVAELPYGNGVVAIEFDLSGERVAYVSYEDWPTPGGYSCVWAWGAEVEDHANCMSHGGGVPAVAFAPDSMSVATGSNERTVRVFRIDSGRELAHLPHAASVTAVAFDSIGRVATASGDTAYIWQVERGAERIRVEHDTTIVSLAFTPDSRRLISVSGVRDSGSWTPSFGACVWEVSTGLAVACTTRGVGTSAAVTPDGRRLVSGDPLDTVRVREVDAGEQQDLPLSERTIFDIDVSADGGRLAVSTTTDLYGNEGELQLWELAGRRIAAQAHEGGGGRVTLSPDGRRILIRTKDGPIFLWDPENDPAITLLDDGAEVTDVTFSESGRRVAIAGANGSVRVWDAETGEPVGGLSHWPGLSPESQRERVINIDRPEANPVVAEVIFSPDDRWIVTGTGDPSLVDYDEGSFLDAGVYLWDADTGVLVRRLPHEGAVVAVAFSADGRWIASASVDALRIKGEIRVWEAETGQEIGRLPHDDLPRPVAFSPNAQLIATGGADGAVHVWPWRPEALIEEACARLNRNLMLEEWRQYFGAEGYRVTCPNLAVPEDVAEMEIAREIP